MNETANILLDLCKSLLPSRIPNGVILTKHDFVKEVAKEWGSERVAYYVEKALTHLETLS